MPGKIVTFPVDNPSGNPFRDSQLGYRIWEKGWRPVDQMNCEQCGESVKVVLKINKALQVCPKCKSDLSPPWAHPQFPDQLKPYEIWRRMVLRQWRVDIGKRGQSYHYATKDEMSESEREQMRLEGLL